MASENVERQMEFILEEQARGAARLGQLEDIVVRFAQATRDRFEATDRFAQATRDRCEASDQRVDNIDEKIAALVDSQLRTEENVKKTDEALRSLIATMERHLGKGSNGKSKE